MKFQWLKNGSTAFDPEIDYATATYGRKMRADDSALANRLRSHKMRDLVWILVWWHNYSNQPNGDEAIDQKQHRQTRGIIEKLLDQGAGCRYAVHTLTRRVRIQPGVSGKNT